MSLFGADVIVGEKFVSGGASKMLLMYAVLIKNKPNNRSGCLTLFCSGVFWLFEPLCRVTKSTDTVFYLETQTISSVSDKC